MVRIYKLYATFCLTVINYSSKQEGISLTLSPTDQSSRMDRKKGSPFCGQWNNWKSDIRYSLKTFSFTIFIVIANNKSSITVTYGNC